MNIRIYTKRAIKILVAAIIVIILFSHLVQDNKREQSSSHETIQHENGIIQYQNETLYAKDNPHIITEDFTIPKGTCLTIEPGTILKFANHSQLIVEGILIAEGSSDKWITFTSNSDDPTKGDWGGIVFRRTDTKKSIIKYSKIDFATRGIMLYFTSPVISNSIIVNNSRNGIDIGISSTKYDPSWVPIISYNTISNNDGEGIKCGHSTIPIITNNIIEKNKGGGISIYSHYLTSPIINNNTLRDNRPAIYCHEGSNPIITNNTIVNGSLVFHQVNSIKSNPILYNNTISNTSFKAIYNYYYPPSKAIYTDPNNNNYAAAQVVKAQPSDWIINAENNYWGTNNESEIADSMLGKVDFDPWLDENGSTHIGTGISPNYSDNYDEESENEAGKNEVYFEDLLIFFFIVVITTFLIIRIRRLF